MHRLASDLAHRHACSPEQRASEQVRSRKHLRRIIACHCYIATVVPEELAIKSGTNMRECIVVPANLPNEMRALRAKASEQVSKVEEALASHYCLPLLHCHPRAGKVCQKIWR